MQSRPKTTQAMRITRRSLELFSENVGIRQNIEDRTATTVAAPKASLMTELRFAADGYIGPDPGFNKTHRSKSDGEAEGI